MTKPVKRQAAPQPPMPWDPALLEPGEISAIKAMAAQHPRGFEALLKKVLGEDRMEFTVGGEEGRRASDFAAGLRFGARQARRVSEMTMPSPTRGAPRDLPNSPTPMPASAEKPQT